MANNIVDRDGSLNGPFLMKAYGDAMALVSETADYLQGTGVAECEALDAPLRAVFAGESMRLTTRLMQVVSWFLVWRGVEAGELTKEQGREPGRRLGAVNVCMGVPARGTDQLPDQLLDLLDRSKSLFEQVMRIEAMILDDGNDEGASPVHKLIDRLKS